MSELIIIDAAKQEGYAATYRRVSSQPLSATIIPLQENPSDEPPQPSANSTIILNEKGSRVL